MARTPQYNQTRQLIIASLFTALTAAGAFVRIPFPLAPVTLQTLITMLAGSVLSPRYAMLSQLVYVITGLLGLPVFTQGGGPGYVLQPTFGYLAALPLAAWSIASLNRAIKSNNSWLKRVAINFTGSLFILIPGVFWLIFIVQVVLNKPVAFSTMLVSGLVIFMPGELIKSAITAFVSPVVNKTIYK